MEKISKEAKIAMGAGAAILLGGSLIYYLTRTPTWKKAIVGDSHADPGYDKNIFLTKQEAIKRKELVSDVHYDIVLVLLKGKNINFYDFI